MLFPCPACARHVRVGDESCPFCGGPAPSPTTLPAGFGRAARAVAPLLAAGLLAGCEEKPAPTSAASASTPSAGPTATTAVASTPATTATASATAASAATASVSGQGSASASNAHPPATVTATATTTAKPLWVPPPNVKKPYGAPPADGWPFEA